MKQVYVYFIFCVLDNNVFLKRILLYTLKQNFSILRHLVGEISQSEFDAYRVTLPGTSDSKLFVGGVSILVVGIIRIHYTSAESGIVLSPMSRRYRSTTIKVLWILCLVHK